MISRTAEYGVRAVVILAHHFGERLVSAEEIASILGAPKNYLAKTLHTLARSGILTSARGPGGGFTLAIPPDALSVAAVVDVFDGVHPGESRCLIRDAACDPANPCEAHQRWSAVLSAARHPLQHTAVSELCGEAGLERAVGHS